VELGAGQRTGRFLSRRHWTSLARLLRAAARNPSLTANQPSAILLHAKFNIRQNLSTHKKLLQKSGQNKKFLTVAAQNQ